jgi:hypothetical protein
VIPDGAEDTGCQHDFVGISADKIAICATCHGDYWEDTPPSLVVATIGVNTNPVQLLLVVSHERIDSGVPFTMEETLEVLGMAQRMLSYVVPEECVALVTMVPREAVDAAAMSVMSQALADAAENN